MKELFEKLAPVGQSDIMEAVKAQKLKDLVAKSGDPDLLKKLHGFTNLRLDQLTDEDVAHATITHEEKEYGDGEKYIDTRIVPDDPEKDRIYPRRQVAFWILNKMKKSPSRQEIQPGIIAVTDDGKVLYSVEDKYTRTKPEGGQPAAPRGLNSYERLKDFADEVYILDPEALSRSRGWGDERQPGKGAEELQRGRKEARRGATALIPPEKFAEYNNRKYRRILAQRRPSEELKSLAGQLNTFVAQKLQGISMASMEDAKARVPGLTNRYGQPLAVSGFMRAVQSIWEDLDRAQRDYSEAVQNRQEDEAAKARGEEVRYDSGKYSEVSYQNYLERAQKAFDELKAGKADVSDW